MIEAFDSVDIAMMCHPYPVDWPDPIKFAMDMYDFFLHNQ